MKKMGLFVGMCILLGACNTMPIYQVNGREVTLREGQTMRQAILEGGIKKGWAMHQVKDGLIQGQLLRRIHEVKVNIPYTDDSYAIEYSDSVNMKYNAKSRSIHKKYAQWVRNLDKAILQAAQ